MKAATAAAGVVGTLVVFSVSWWLGRVFASPRALSAGGWTRKG